MSLTADPVRLWMAAATLLMYFSLCAAMGVAQIRKRRATAQRKSRQDETQDWIVAYASQTGSAEELAHQTAATLQLAGLSAWPCSLSDLNADRLARARRILFLVSTYGEGDPPDEAAVFAGRWMGTELPLSHLHYAVLALGDRTYVNFCGFGKALDEWLQLQGARPMFDRVDVDRSNPATLDLWRQRLSHLAGTSDAPDWNGPSFTDWRLVDRRLMNPGSVGGAVYHLELKPAHATLPSWKAGDLAQVLAPGDAARARDYSIASVSDDGCVHLLVRQHRQPDGAPGTASGWLTSEAAVGERIRMRLREHRRFRIGDNAARPLVLIGNGTGMAGLRSHLRARARTEAGPNWLIFGERNASCDFHYREEIEVWHASGLLARLDAVFSRDGHGHRYVQDRLAEAGDMLREWIGRGAAIYVCGSRQGMAGSVDAVLRELLSSKTVDALNAVGRYRRDVY